MSSNYQFLLDSDGDSSDWIEIYNNSNDSINLSSYYLSDDAKKIDKWIFPDIVLAPYDFLLVFASSKDTVYDNGEIHTNFSISQKGESLLISKDYQVIDFFEAIFFEQDLSYGRFPDGSNNKKVFYFPSPGYKNIDSIPEVILFSRDGGKYDTLFDLYLSCVNHENRIYYTLDGSIPTISDFLFSEKICLNNYALFPHDYTNINLTPEDEFFIPELDQTHGIIIRAAAFDSNNNIVSKVNTQSYFFKDLGFGNTDIPILSIVVNYEDMFDYYSGIMVAGANYNSQFPKWTGNYYMRGKAWEREINAEFYEVDNTCGFNQTMGLRTHGGSARLIQQKGLKLYADSEYGKNFINYEIFDDKNINLFRRLVLKPWSTSWTTIGVEDYITNKLARKLNLDNISSRPCVLFINGQYWGMYYISEKIDEYYIEENFGVDSDDVIIVSSWDTTGIDKPHDDFINLYNYIKDTDFSIEQNYYDLCQKVDINNFIDYLIFETYIANQDWPVNNMRCWKTKDNGSKWRWIFMDGDAALAEKNHDSFEQLKNYHETCTSLTCTANLFFYKLFENKNFENSFFLRFKHLLINELNFDSGICELKNSIEFANNQIFYQMDRFGYPQYLYLWLDAIKRMEDFFAFRNCELERLVNRHFDIKLKLPDCNKFEPEISSFVIYPNPCSNDFSLEFNAESPDHCMIKISNSLGENIKVYNHFANIGLNIFYFDDINLINGIYYVSVFYRRQLYGTKIVVIQ